MKVAFLTSGGLAPCLSTAIGALVQRYHDVAPDTELIGYLNGYKGLLTGQSIVFPPSAHKEAATLFEFGGTPIGNSRVKLSNAADCEKKGLVKNGENPFEVAAKRLMADKVNVLHTIGGDDTNTTAAELAKYLQQNNYPLQVIGLPKTIDNDIIPVQLSLGAMTAAEQGALFFENIVHEHTSTSKVLIIHEVMGRSCGWLNYATARRYMERLERRKFVPGFGFRPEAFEIHGIYTPEMKFDLDAVAAWLKPIFERVGSLNVFISEFVDAEGIVRLVEAEGKKVERDAFGHLKLADINVGQVLGKQLKERLGAERLLVQKSGYFARSAPANAFDRNFIQSHADLAVECALNGQSGLIGHDTRHNNQLRCIEFEAVSGNRPLDLNLPEVKEFLERING